MFSSERNQESILLDWKILQSGSKAIQQRSFMFLRAMHVDDWITEKKLTYKEAPIRKLEDILYKISFFNERFAVGNIQLTIVAIPVENPRDDEEIFKIAMLSKTAKQLRL
jgi:hypothetical protein